jgi:predicted NAD/FAD-dependent oxidoreductase
MTIAVVGAGIAGLSAARALRDRGHPVIVFEREEGPGGRVATHQVRHLEMPRALAGAALAFDHGAQYFTVRDRRFSEVVAEWERDRVVARWTGRIVSFDDEGWEDVDESTARYVGTPGMDAIAARLAGDLEIRYGQRIRSLEPLLDAFERVIVAVPAPQAAHLVSHRPQLVSRTFAAPTLPCWAVMAAFEERVAARFDAAFVNGSPLGWIARNTSKPKRDWKVDCWVLHATNAWSQAHVEDDPEHIGSFLMDAFGDLVHAGLPRAFYATVHRWRFANADPALAAGAVGDAEARITLCGDWCLGSRIEDAYLSGLAAASQITR